MAPPNLEPSGVSGARSICKGAVYAGDGGALYVQGPKSWQWYLFLPGADPRPWLAMKYSG